ncbi:trithorax group protein osa isoform X2 [Aplysia californica]|uniref:Trithorax group protein osa isoform X2 n=1 Tax=Aplysia californica TaxID=6500 RepID=A0ABM0JH47_APLCA|nr:trithorax group protein osa isoform X2 [Aplysia californica]
MGDIVKCGYVKRYSKSILNGGWNNSFLQLHRDSTLNVYKKQGDSKVQGSIFVKEVCKYFAYGEYTSGMPDRPEVPSGASYDWIMGIPQKPSSKAKIHWFLFSSSNELHEWMTAICGTLPPPPHKEATAEQAQPVKSAPPPPGPPAGPPAGHYAPPAGQYPPPAGQYGPPPPYYGPPPPGGPGPSFGFENLNMGGAAPPYPQQPQYRPPPVQGHYPPPGPYPTQGHYPPPPAGHYGPPPPQGGYPQQPYYSAAPAPSGYPQQQYYHAPAGGYPQQAYGYQHPPVIVQQNPKKKKGVLSSNTGKMAAGLAGGALVGYGASRMMGGGWGMGHWGSWSSLSSIGSFGSCGSFGSFGSFG